MNSHDTAKRENEMNGLSDVRLTLRQYELLKDGQPDLVGGPSGNAAGETRWALFWRRLTTRRALLRLNEAQLKDIGLTPAEARREVLRPFWTL